MRIRCSRACSCACSARPLHYNIARRPSCLPHLAPHPTCLPSVVIVTCIAGAASLLRALHCTHTAVHTLDTPDSPSPDPDPGATPLPHLSQPAAPTFQQPTFAHHGARYLSAPAVAHPCDRLHPRENVLESVYGPGRPPDGRYETTRPAERGKS